MKEKLNFAQFVEKIWDKIKIIYDKNVYKAFTDGRTKIFINSYLKDKEERKFVILHELAHIYLNYLNDVVQHQQPNLMKENESLCDILATLYLKRISKWSSEKIINCMTLLSPNYISHFRIQIIRNLLNKFENVKDITNEI
jgi:hypothetical protein